MSEAEIVALVKKAEKDDKDIEKIVAALKKVNKMPYDDKTLKFADMIAGLDSVFKLVSYHNPAVPNRPFQHTALAAECIRLMLGDYTWIEHVKANKAILKLFGLDKLIEDKVSRRAGSSLGSQILAAIPELDFDDMFPDGPILRQFQSQMVRVAASLQLA